MTLLARQAAQLAIGGEKVRARAFMFGGDYLRPEHVEQNSKRPQVLSWRPVDPRMCRGRVAVNHPDRRHDQGKLAGRAGGAP